MAAPIIPIALLLLFLGGDKKKKKKTPPTTTGELPEGPPPGELPEEPIPGMQVVPGFDLPPPPPDQPAIPFFVPDDPATIVFSQLLSPIPMPGRGYKIVKGDNMSNVINRALTVGYGRPPTNAERSAYKKATTRVRSNWMLYSTENTNPQHRVEVTDVAGQAVYGSILSSFTRMHDSWPAAMADDEMPNRLIRFKRGSKGQTVPLQGWNLIAHGPATEKREYATIFLPPLACIFGGIDVHTDPTCDWPPSLWGATDTMWSGFDGMPS